MAKFTQWLLENTIVCGECFQYAYQLFKKLAEAGEDVTLVHGTIIHPLTRKKIAHAWVVYKGDVYDWQSAGKRSSRKEFIKLWKPTIDKAYLSNDLLEVLLNLAKTKHYGPWDE